MNTTNYAQWAEISECGDYRYSLGRNTHRASGQVLFIGLNPSTADALTDDPTIRRCLGYVADWGYSGLLMGNLFAFRATKPKDMLAAQDPIGPKNDSILRHLVTSADLVVAAWGTNGGHLGRADEVRRMFPGQLHYLKLTKEGHPGHPLYLPKTLKPQLWEDLGAASL